jgi:hypothetical protein
VKLAPEHTPRSVGPRNLRAVRYLSREIASLMHSARRRLRTAQHREGAAARGWPRPTATGTVRAEAARSLWRWMSIRIVDYSAKSQSTTKLFEPGRGINPGVGHLGSRASRVFESDWEGCAGPGRRQEGCFWCAADSSTICHHYCPDRSVSAWMDARGVREERTRLSSNPRLADNSGHAQRG